MLTQGVQGWDTPSEPDDDKKEAKSTRLRRDRNLKTGQAGWVGRKKQSWAICRMAPEWGGELLQPLLQPPLISALPRHPREARREVFSAMLPA